VRGLVVAATGNGTVNGVLQQALDQARAAGLPVWRATRCAGGVLVGQDTGPGAAMTPWQARIGLMLTLMLSAQHGGG
jgi:L-asparaginase